VNGWLPWRFFRLRRPFTIPWPSLMLQFGCGYTNPRHFKKRFRGYLRHVTGYCPDVRLEGSSARLLLKPCLTPVLPRPAKSMKL
jgi:hypothetical protein